MDVMKPSTNEIHLLNRDGLQFHLSRYYFRVFLKHACARYGISDHTAGHMSWSDTEFVDDRYATSTINGLQSSTQVNTRLSCMCVNGRWQDHEQRHSMNAGLLGAFIP